MKWLIHAAAPCPPRIKQAMLDWWGPCDVGFLDDEGFLFLCDRKVDLIISGGANIYPAEVEAELMAHPKVADVAVFGVQDEDWGEQVKAVVQPAEGQIPGPALAAELLASLDGRLARMKWPKTVDFIAEMPREPTGKLRKRELRAPYWAGHERPL
jgi:long-chain acyl-CoA synthetase